MSWCFPWGGSSLAPPAVPGLGRRQAAGRPWGCPGGTPEIRGQQRARAGSAAPIAKWPLRPLTLPRDGTGCCSPVSQRVKDRRVPGQGRPEEPLPSRAEPVGLNEARNVLPEPGDGSTILSTAGRPAGGAGGTAQAGWGSHGLCVQELLPLHHCFVCSFPRICHQRAPRGPEPAPALQLQPRGNPRLGRGWTPASHWESVRVPGKAPLEWQRAILLLQPQL